VLKNFYTKLFSNHNSERIYGLDIMRAVAILLVICSHSRFLLFPISNKFDIMKSWGFYGVEIFFVLSGYLIGGILIKQSQNGFSFKKLKTFWVRRWFRTMPNYYLVLLFNLIIIFVLKQQSEFNWHFLSFTQNLFNPHPNFYSEAWSLTIEEWFYIILPFLLVLIFKVIKSTKRAILLSITIVFLFSFIMRVNAVYTSELSWDESLRKIVIYRLDSILIGVFSVWVQFYYPSLWKKKYTSLAIGLALLCVAIFLSETQLYKQPHVFTKIFTFSFFNFGTAFLLPYFSKIRHYKTRLGGIITHISIISYSIYLLHYSIIYRIQCKLFYPETGSEGVMAFSAFILLTILISSINYKVFELPMTRLRERFSKNA